MSQSAQPGTSRKGRSPSYPAISIDAAIERASVLYEREGKHSAPVAAVQSHWGFKSSTGPASVTVAALAKFGLLASEGAGDSRVVRLTDLALTILHSPDESERRAAIQEAALTPQIHSELIAQYDGSLPSDANLRYELVFKRAFTETGAAEFIPQFRRTVAFAQLLGPGTFDDKHQAKDDPREERRLPQVDPVFSPTLSFAPTPQAPPTLTIPIPLVGASQVQIAGAFPISEAAWQQLLAVLTAMKPGLVATEPSESGDTD